MSIEIKRSVKPVDYHDAIALLEERMEKLINKKGKELIWFLEHNEIFTAGTSSNTSDIIDALEVSDIKAVSYTHLTLPTIYSV